MRKSEGTAHVIVFVDAAIVVQQRSSVVGVGQEFVCEACENTKMCRPYNTTAITVNMMSTRSTTSTWMRKVMHDSCKQQRKFLQRGKLPALVLRST